jgi:hypothetical protein
MITSATSSFLLKPCGSSFFSTINSGIKKIEKRKRDKAPPITIVDFLIKKLNKI